MRAVRVDTARMSDEERQRHRVSLVDGLRVFDPQTGEDLGGLGDLSDRGMLLSGPHHFARGARGWFELRLASVETADPPHLEAECVWSRAVPDSRPAQIASGWRFTGSMNSTARALLVASMGRLGSPTKASRRRQVG